MIIKLIVCTWDMAFKLLSTNPNNYVLINILCTSHYVCIYHILLVKIGNNDNFITIDIDDVQLDATLSITRYD